ncbi:hypothetical protein AG1IA_05277 [Rhizoctonia solani AG-1 IA]|uniref:Uncharacterized protein n=1 Tax=Thanatephorus cucumeris (strain AG1-IA) TaxID=983506 RepID=L8WRB9_THACA|nr:hypothetical protein AG1IA_05277 [Rhizoctonia solani AG-1 IA]
MSRQQPLTHALKQLKFIGTGGFGVWFFDIPTNIHILRSLSGYIFYSVSTRGSRDRCLPIPLFGIVPPPSAETTPKHTHDEYNRGMDIFGYGSGSMESTGYSRGHLRSDRNIRSYIWSSGSDPSTKINGKATTKAKVRIQSALRERNSPVVHGKHISGQIIIYMDVPISTCMLRFFAQLRCRRPHNPLVLVRLNESNLVYARLRDGHTRAGVNCNLRDYKAFSPTRRSFSLFCSVPSPNL